MSNLSAMLTVQAGGQHDGQVMFRATHPISKKFVVSRFLIDTEKFCREHGLEFDRSLVDYFLERLNYEVKTGWSVPEHFIDATYPTTSVNSYLRDLQKDLF